VSERDRFNRHALLGPRVVGIEPLLVAIELEP
jgi:hypothetical protein